MSQLLLARTYDLDFSANTNLNSIIQMPHGNYGIGGSLIVNDFDHAYAAIIDKSGEKIIWDNTEILYNSGLALEL